MTPPWSGQFVLSGDGDPHVGRFVCCTDATLHLDDEDLKEYVGDDPAERADFIAYHDPATVLSMYDELAGLREEVRLADDGARKMREAYADGLREWAEGGRVWRMQQALEHLAEELRQVHGWMPDRGRQAYVGQLIAVAKDPEQLVTRADTGGTA